jgi:DNA-binding LacI/PurR family transcriptional regulator
MLSTPKDPSRTIGILASSLSSVFVNEALQGLEEGLKGSDFELALFETEGLNVPEKNHYIESLALEKKAAAFVYVHLPLNAAQVAMFRDNHIPLAYLAGRMEGVDWFMVDEVMGAYLATKHLLSLKHRRIALVSGPLVALESRLREDGFLRALKEQGAEYGRHRDIKILNYSEGEGYDAANLLLDLQDFPTAIFVSAGDLTALGVMTAIRDRGLKVGRDVSVVGYDDLRFAATLDPPLTTVKQPLREMGRQAVLRLLSSLKDPSRKPDGDLYEPELILRHSTAEAHHG